MPTRVTRLLLTCTLLGALVASAPAAHLAIRGDGFTLDGRPLKLWGVRVASATQSDALADHLIANLDDYRAHGVTAITVFYMGSLGGSADPFTPDGTGIDPEHQARMERILRAAAARDLVVIVGIFYQRVARASLRDWTAAQQAVRTVAAALRPHRHVLINPANEQGSDHYDAQPWKNVREPAALLELCRLIKETDPQRLVGAGGYSAANNETIGRSPLVDALLYDHNRPAPTPAELFARYRAAGIAKPIVNVELFGSWTREHRPAGVYADAAKAEHLRAIDDAVRTPGHHLFFHSSPWLQATTEPGTPIRFDLGGNGTAADPGIRWYFEALKIKSTPPAATYAPAKLPPAFHNFAGDTAQPLRVSANGRGFVLADGRPFFWLGDTSWQLIRKSRRDDGPEQPAVEKYFAVRQLQGFNVLQTVACAPFGRGGGSANTYGHTPFADAAFTQPKLGPGDNDDYWDHVDHVLALAPRYGFRVALLPAWLSGFDDDHPWVAEPARAYRYGRFLGQRYGKLPHVIWVTGGDAHLPGRNVDNPTRLALTRAIAEGIADGTNGADGFDGQADWTTTFMTFHPPGGGKSSGDHLHAEPWLDFNLIQTTTLFNFANYLHVLRDYGHTPPKPTLDSEVAYEDSISVKREERPIYGTRRTTEWEVRKAAYWAVFAGAAGHTYGHRSFISWMRRDESGTHGADTPWYERLDAPGALQMKHLRRLIEAHGVLDRVPDHELLEGNPATGSEHAQAARAADGRYALIYIPNGQPVRVNLARLAPRLHGAWFDPRTGRRQPLGEIASRETTTFTPPTNGPRDDWVLELTAR